MVGLRADKASDIGYLLGWTKALARAQRALPLHIDLTHRLGHDYLDLAQAVHELVEENRRFLDDLAKEDGHALELDRVFAATTAEELLAALLEVVTSGAVVLIIQNRSHATDKTRAWADRLLSNTANLSKGFALVVDKRAVELPNELESRRLKPHKEKQIAQHLANKLGYPLDAARKDAESIFGLSGGAPGRVAYEMISRVTARVVPPL